MQICELIVKYILPSVRASLVRKLAENGMSQSEIADILGLSQSAVSRYIRMERGSRDDIVKDREISRFVDQLAGEIFSGKVRSPEEVSERICDFCTRVMKDLGCRLMQEVCSG